MTLQHFAQKYKWTILVWVILGLFIFPLTPPISYHNSYDNEVLVVSNTTQVLTVQETPPTREILQNCHNMIHWHDDFHKEYFITVFVVFITFIQSRVCQRLKEILLAFLKFTSDYTGLIHSFLKQVAK
ncbi:hypothetical protein [Paenibacillus sp. N3.4]|uniref:hypothetical protein n=1 Tax=Paenibacillus sp. N3.4 TaxID=2603222 RepID=UPI0011CA410B|nr:hypothetical protein [Paenibacillus sp. N3.4]TXK76945.1 hypothetical protein FU659_24005 [Paenibacillus sp. N3.4]